LFYDPKRKGDSKAENYSYDNVDVYFTKNLVLPLKALKKRKDKQGLKSAKAILKKIRFEPDIIHAHFTWPAGWVAEHLGKDMGVPVVITIHEDHKWLRKEGADEKNQQIWKDADLLIRVNHLDVPYLQGFNKNIKSIPNGYLHNRFRPLDQARCRSELGLSNGKIFFSLGDLIPRKGYQDLLEASHQAIQKGADFSVIIGGNGPMRDELETRIFNLGMKDKFRLIGYVSDTYVPTWMNAADYFILPSYSEGNPTVLVEAIGCGKPYIGTPVGGVPEIINSEDLGLLTEPGDIDALSDVLTKTIEKNWDHELILEYSKDYTWEAICERIIKVYKKLL